MDFLELVQSEVRSKKKRPVKGRVQEFIHAVRL